MSTRYNPKQIGPSPEFPEVGRVEVDLQVAQNSRREGPRQAEEGLGNEPAYRGAFGQGAAFARDGSSHQFHDAIEAGQANGRGRLGAGQEIPAWNAVDSAERNAFLQGQDISDQVASPSVFPHQPRAGANPNPLGPTWGFSAGAEVPGNIFVRQIARPEAGRGRRNQADCTEL